MPSSPTPRSSTKARVRAAIRERWPAVVHALRPRLRVARDLVRWLEARVRVQLPQRWGGAFAANQLHARELTRADRAALTQLRAAPPELFESSELAGEAYFGIGLYLRDALVAVGFCGALGPAEHPYQRALFYADFVSPRLRRRHLGRALHRARLERLQQLGAAVVYAWVEPHNKAARASLYACGFRETTREQIWGQASAAHLLLRRELIHYDSARHWVVDAGV